MTLEEHAEHTYDLFGLRAYDIHIWMDGFFSDPGLKTITESGVDQKKDPFAHRRFRHCSEALSEAIAEFASRYDIEQITKVFETHIRDDYSGYIPVRSDFDNPFFLDRYHSAPGYVHEAILSSKEFENYFHPKKKNSRIASKLFALRIVIPAITVIALFFASLFIVIKPVLNSIMMDGKKQVLRSLVSSGISTLKYFSDLEKSGTLSLQDAKAAAVDELFKIRFGEDNKDYFWIIDKQPVMIMHPYRPELIGQNVSTYRDREDKSGINIFSEAVKVTEKTGEGTLSYLWQWKDDPNSIAPKLSFVRTFSDWDWIVGTGLYFHDVKIEIERITNRIFIIFSVVALIATIIVITIIANSAKIEQSRVKAEKGLKEAKDRYQALVLVSSEGKALFMDGHPVFCNPQFSRLCGFDSDQLSAIDPSILFSNWQSLLQNISISSKEIQQFSELLTTRGTRIPIHVTATKVFFESGDGIALSIYPKTESVADNFLRGQIRPATPHHWEEVLKAISSTDDIKTVYAMHAEAVLFIKTATAKDLPSQEIRTLISELWYSLAKAFIRLSLLETGPAPCDFVFLALGSNARREMTLFSDQDNALIWSAGDEHKSWFLSLGKKIVAYMERAGFRPCPGGITAAQPDWCVPAERLFQNISEWMDSGKSEELLRITTLFDYSLVTGNEQLVANLQSKLSASLKKTPGFLALWATHVTGFRLPKDAYTSLLRIKSTEPKTRCEFPVKECLKILENIARILAAQNSITEAGCIERIDRLNQAKTLPQGLYLEFMFAFEELWKLRLWGQFQNWEHLQEPNDLLDLSPFPDTKLRQIKLILESIEAMMNHVSFHFFGRPQ